MSFVTNTNISALNAINQGKINAKSLNNSLERLSSGLRINSYADDIGSAISADTLRSSSSTISADIKSANETLTMLQIADKAIDEQLNILDTIKSRAIQAASDGISKNQREALQKEVLSLLDEMDNIAKNTRYNGKQLLTGDFANKTLQIGDKSNEQIKYSIGATDSFNIGKVRYETTNGGSRDISNLSLNFKGAGANGSDVALEPFHLSSTPGKSLKDLADYINTKSNSISGIRAIYKEGKEPTPTQLAKLQEAKKLQESSIDTWDAPDPTKQTLDNAQSIEDFDVFSSDEEIIAKNQEDLLDDTSLDKKVKPSKESISTKTSNENIQKLKQAQSKQAQEVEDRVNEYVSSLNSNHIKEILNKNDNTEIIKEFVDEENKKTKNAQEIQNEETQNTQDIDTTESKKIKHKSPEASFDTFDTKASALNQPYDNIQFRAQGKATISTTFKEAIANDGTIANTATINLGDNVDAWFTADISLASSYLTLTRISGVLTFNGRRFTKDSFTQDIAIPGVGQAATKVSTSGNIYRIEGLGGGKVRVSSPNKYATRVQLKGSRRNSATAYTNQIVSTTKGGTATTISSPNLPSGLTASYKTLNFSQIEVKLEGSAISHDNSDDISNLQFDIQGTFSAGLNPASITNGTIDFISTPSASKIIGSFKEAIANDGTIANTATIDLGDNAKSAQFTADVSVASTLTRISGVLRYNSSYWAGTETFTQDVAVPGVGQVVTGVTSNGHIYRIEGLGGGKVRVSSPNKYIARIKLRGTHPGSISAVYTNQVVSTTKGGTATTISSPNLPSGLTASYKTLNFSQVEVKLEGSAISHDDSDNIKNLQFDIQGVFSAGVNPSSITNGTIDFINNPPTAKIISSFKEATANDGSISTRATIEIANGTLTSNIANLITPVGLPSGLTASYVRANDSQIEVSLNGKALVHQDSDDVDNLKFNFQNGLIGAALGQLTGASIDFNNNTKTQATISTSFKEAIANNGTIANTATINLGDNASSVQVTAKNLPSGLTASYKTLNPSQIEVKLEGSAISHKNSDDVRNLQFDIQGVFSSGVNPASITNGTIDFIDPPSAKLIGSFVESNANDGSISTSATVEITNGVITSKINIGHGLGDIAFNNLPYGLEPVFTRLDDTHIKIDIIGNALSHQNSDDVTRVELELYKNLVGNHLPNIKNITVDFIDNVQQQATINTSFKEKIANDGTIANTATINFNDNFKPSWSYKNKDISIDGSPSAFIDAVILDGVNYPARIAGHGFGISKARVQVMHNGRVRNILLDSKPANNGQQLPWTISLDDKTGINSFQVSFNKKDSANILSNFVDDSLDIVSSPNLPSGLTASYKTLNNSQVEVKLEGSAISHKNSDDVRNLQFDIKGTFSSGVNPSSITNGTIDFIDPPSAKIINSFKEATANDGSISTRATIEIANGILTSNIANLITPIGLPSGLTASYIRANNSQIEVSLNGKASAHQDSDDVDNLKFNFKNGLVGVALGQLTNASIDFNNNTKAQATISTSFKEAIANDGTIANTATINLGDNASGVQVTAKNLPSGLTASYKTLNPSQIEVKLEGSAISHKNSDDVRNLQFDIQGVFSSGVNPASITNGTIDFIDPPSAKLIGSFVESNANDGSISTSATVEITNGVITSKINIGHGLGDIAFNNLPYGLEPVFTRLDDTHIKIDIIGNALSHQNSDDTNRVELELYKNLVGNHLPNIKNITVDFIDNVQQQATINTSFKEKIANDGTIANTATINFNDNFKPSWSYKNKDISIDGSPSAFIDAVILDGVNYPARIAGHGFGISKARVQVMHNGRVRNILLDSKPANNGQQLPWTISLDDKTGINSFQVSFNKKDSANILSNFVDDSLDIVSSPNLPYGLTASYKTLNNSQVEVKLEGSAISHKNSDDISNLRFDIKGTFSSGLNPLSVNNGTVDFLDPPSAKIINSFKEATANDGSISTRATIEIANGILTSNIANLITPIGLPSGLTASYVRANNSQIEVSLNGKASAHQDSDDVDNLKFNFQNGLVGVALGQLTGASIDFNNNTKAQATISTSFKEAIANNGTIANTATINLGDNASGVQVTAKNLPSGLTASYKTLNPSQIEVKLEGSAISHSNSDDVRNLQFDIKGTFSSGVNPASITNGTIDFIDPPSAKLIGSFVESNANDGSISTSATVEITNGVITSKINIGHGLGDIAFNNLPYGLEPVFTRLDDTHIKIDIIGNALSHQNSDDTNRVELELYKNLVGNHLPNIKNITVDFIDNVQQQATINTSFKEKIANDGTIANTATINFNDNFKPSWSYKNKDISIDGSPSAFIDAVILDGVNYPARIAGHGFGISKARVQVMHNGRVRNILLDSKPANNGQQLPWTISLDDKTGINSFQVSFNKKDSANILSNFVDDSLDIVSSPNLPSGLTASYKTLNNSQVEVKLEGSALSHSNSDDISNLRFDIKGTFSAGLNPLSVNNGTVDFLDPPSAKIINSFKEATTNDGAISTRATIEIANGILTSNIANLITPIGLPSGLTASYVRANNSQIEVSLNGKASAHQDSDDVDNLKFNFKNGLVGVALGQLTNASIDFNNNTKAQATISTSFKEAIANDGTIANTATINLGDNASGVQVTAKNLPSGLTASYKTLNPSQIEVKLEGSAISHKNSDDVRNLQFDIQGVFSSGVNPASITNGTIDFIDPPSAKLIGSFVESNANDGSISTSATVEITNGVITSKINIGHGLGDIAFNNLPYGLEPVFTRLDDTHIKIDIIGNALSHQNSDDVTRVELELYKNLVGNHLPNIKNITVDFIDNVQQQATINTSFKEKIANDGTIANTATINFNDNFKPSWSYKNKDISIDGSPSAFIDAVILDGVNYPARIAGHGFGISKARVQVMHNGRVRNILLDSKPANNGQQLPWTISLDDKTGINSFQVSFNKKDSANILSNFVDDSLDIVSSPNLPSGLTASYKTLNNSQVEVKLEGSAISHKNSDDISNLRFDIKGTFSSGLNPLSVNNGTVDFLDPPSAKAIGSFKENIKNDGTINTFVTIDITNGIMTSNINNLITATNIPSNLSASYTRISDTRLKVTLEGTAISHTNNDDVSNVEFSFNNKLLNNPLADLKNVNIDFFDASVKSNGIFKENPYLNNGSILTDIMLEFSGLVLSNNVTPNIIAYNIPNGLTTKYTRVDDTHIKVQLTGNALSHKNTNDTKISFSFTPDISTTKTLPNSGVDSSIDFIDDIILFKENLKNDGSIGNTITLSNIPANQNITAFNLPSGLSASYKRIDATNIEVTLVGNAASHRDTNDTFVTFKTNNYSQDVSVDFFDISFSKSKYDVFIEDLAKNNGTIANKITLQLNNASLADNIANKIKASNIPLGLSASYAVLLNASGENSNKITVALEGQAKDHNNINDVLDVSFSFYKDITKNQANVDGYDNVYIDFFDPGYDFKENKTLNDGSIGNKITFTRPLLPQGGFDTNFKIDSISNVPAGLNATFRDIPGGKIEVQLIGKANQHSKADDTSLNVKFNYSDTLVPVKVSYYDNDLIKLQSGGFLENPMLDNGSILTTLTLETKPTVTLSNSIIGKITASNVPAGLNAKFQRVVTGNAIDQHKIKVSLIGNALSHDVADSISNIKFSFNPSITTLNTPINDINNVYVEFVDKLIFKEDPQTNNGAIKNKLYISIPKDSTNSYDASFKIDSFSNTKAFKGLTPTSSKFQDSLLEISLSGKALKHEDKDDGFIYAKVSKYNEPIPLSVDFIDNSKLTTQGVFKESLLNDGSIANRVTVELSGNQFVNYLSDAQVKSYIKYPNLPVSLDASYHIVDATHLSIQLNGRAAAHDNANDTASQLTLSDDLFVNKTGDSKARVSINFIEQPIVDIKPIFHEKIDNDGSIANRGTLSIKKDIWNIKRSFPYAAKMFKGDNLIIENLRIDGIDVMPTGNFTIDDLVNQIGYNTNGMRVTTIKGNKATIFAENRNGTLVVFSNDIKDGDGLDFSYKLQGFNYINPGDKLNDPSISHFINEKGLTEPEIVNHINIKNLPNNLLASYKYISPSLLEVELKSKSINHKNINDVKDLSFEFNSKALFYEGILPSKSAMSSIDFIDVATLSLSGDTFVENATNQGKTDTKITINAKGDDFSLPLNSTSAQIQQYVRLSTIPNGLTAQYKMIDSKNIEVSLVGNAISHANSDDVNNLKLNVTGGAFLDKKTPVVKYDNLSIDFIESTSITPLKDTFYESALNDGSIKNKITFNIQGGGVLKTKDKTLSYGFLLNIPDKINDKILIDGTPLNIDKNKTADDLRTNIIDFINNGGNGTIINNNRLFAKAVNSQIMILKNTNNPLLVSINNSSFSTSYANNLNNQQRTISLIDNTLDLNALITFAPPAGIATLQPTFSPINKTTIEMGLQGSAINHNKANSTTGNVVFDKNIFKDPTSITQTLQSNVDIKFIDEVKVTLNNKEFTEKGNDVGSIKNSITATISGATIASTIPNARLKDYIDITKVPQGLTPNFSIIDNKHIKIELLGNAISHKALKDNIQDISLSFKKEIFTTASVTNKIKDISVRYLDASNIQAIPNTFNEKRNDVGEIVNKITLELSGDTFDTNSAIKTTAYNISTGLTPTYSYINNSQMEVALLGNASRHKNSDDIHNVIFDFTDDMFTSKIKSNTLSHVSINFGNKASLTLNRQDFNEGPYLDNGSIINPITMTITGGGELDYHLENFKFASVLKQDNVYNILDGKKLSINGVDIPINTRLYNTKNTSFVNHIASLINNGWDGFTLSGSSDKLFATTKTNANGSTDIILLKQTPQALNINTGLTSNSYANDGSISPNLRNVKVPINNTTLTSRIQYNNIPSGLTPVFNAIDTKRIEVVLEGKAIDHRALKSISNASFSLDSDIIKNALFIDSAKNVAVNFVDQIKLNDGQVFTESLANDGSIKNIININLGNTKLDTTLTKIDNLIHEVNMPNGLTPKYSITNANTLKIELLGKAKNHADIINDTKLLFDFNANLFTQNPIHTYETSVDFIDRAVISILPSFTESTANDGSIANNATINIKDDDLAANINQNNIAKYITTSTIPAGLNISYKLLDKSTIEASLDGKAIDNKNINDVSPFTFSFDKDMFKGKVAPQSVDTKIDFFDNIVITPSSKTFLESDADDGSIKNKIILDTTFGGDINKSIANGSKINSVFYKLDNVPKGLDISLVKLSDKQIEVSLINNALSHDITDGIKNLDIKFNNNFFTSNLSSPKVQLGVEYIKRAKLLANSSFIENTLDVGEVSNKVTINITKDSIDPLITNANINNFINITTPLNGLKDNYRLLNTSQVEISLSGKAVNHQSPVDDKILKVNFDGAMFKRNVLSENVDVNLDFINKAVITTNALSYFQEDPISNNGTILKNPIRLTITNANAARLKKEPVSFNFGASMSYLNTVAGNTTIKFGSSSVLSLAGVNNRDDAVALINNNDIGTNIGDEQVYARADINNPDAILLYKRNASTLTFQTSGANTQNITNQANIGNRTFNVVDRVAMQNRISSNNLSNGLNAKFVPISVSEIDVYLDNQAIKHNNADDVNNLNFTLLDELFEDSISAISPNVVIDYVDDSPAFALNGFQESIKNDGSMAGYATVMIPNASLNKNIFTNSEIRVLNIPNGLSLGRIEKANPHELRVELNGKATAHDVSDNTHVTLEFLKGTIFTPNAKPSKVEIPISYTQKPDIQVVGNKIFKETSANDGTLSGAITLAVNNTKIVANPNSLITTNLPYELKASYSLIDDKHIRMNIEGKAIAHLDANDIDNLNIEFDGGLFESGVKPDNINNVSLDYIDASKASVSGLFLEDPLRPGFIGDKNKVTVTILEDKFNLSRTNVTNGINLSNLPVGLRHKATLINNSQVEIQLLGRANKNKEDDSIDNIKISFIDTNMFSSATLIDDIYNISLGFFDNTKITTNDYFRESLNNDGKIENEVTLINKENSFANIPSLQNDIRIDNLPRGYTPTFRYIDSGHIAIKLSGFSALNKKINNTTLQLQYTNPDLFTNKVVPSPHDIDIKYIDENSINYRGSFTEISNSGKYQGKVLVTLEGDAFDINTPVTKNNVQVIGLPPGIEAQYRYISGSVLEVTLSGQATKHSVADNTKLDISFPNRGIFVSKQNKTTLRGITLTNNDASAYKIIGSFMEREDDKGIIASKATISLLNDKFNTQADLSSLIDIKNLPIGLQPSYSVTNEKDLVVSLGGSALLSHAKDTAISLSFSGDALQSKIPIDTASISIDFINKTLLDAPNAFMESFKNDGSMIDKGVTISLRKGKFKFDGDYDKLTTSYNIPTGLTPKYKFIDDTHLKITLDGKAKDHKKANSNNLLSFTFDDKLFEDSTKVTATNVQINYIDAPDIIINGSFIEDIKDDGSFINTVNITLGDDEINDVDLNKEIKVTNLPEGLTAKFEKITPNQMTMNLTSSAKKHDIKDSTQISLDFLDTVFKSKRRSLDVKKIDVAFRNTPAFSAKDFVFHEQIDKQGQIQNTLTLKLNNGSFQPDIDPNGLISVRNLPLGLSPKFSISGNNLQISLQGRALNHKAENSINDLIFSFRSALFNDNISSKDIKASVDFIDTSRFVTSGRFKEDSNNNGVISNTLTFNLQGDLIRNINPNQYITALNVPQGLRARFSTVSDNAFAMELIGQAVKHGDQDDTNSITLKYKDEFFKSGRKAIDTKNIAIDFRDPPQVESSGIFLESKENDGTISTAVTLYAKNDYFNTKADPNQLIATSDLPDGMGILFKTLNSQTIVATLTGKASKHTAKDNKTLTFSFEGKLFEGKISPSNLTADILFDSVNAARLIPRSAFQEDIENNGTIVNEVVVDIKNDKLARFYALKTSMIVDNIFDFTGDNPLDEESYITINGHKVDVDLTLLQINSEPSFLIKHIVDNINNKGKGTFGIYAKLVRDLSGAAKLVLIKDKDDTKTVFSGKTNNTKTLTNYYNTNEKGFQKSLGLNDDEFKIVKDNFADRLTINRQLPLEWFIDKFITARYVPVGLTPAYEKISDDKLLFKLLGSTPYHNDIDDVNAIYNLNKELFEKRLQPLDMTIRVNFDNPVIDKIGKFTEIKKNNGSVDGKVTLILSGDEFRDRIDVNRYIYATNLPEGLRASFVKEANNIIIMTLHGNAKDHEKSDSTKRVKLDFDKRLFKHQVAPRSVDDINIDFKNSNSKDGSGGPGSDGGFLTFINYKGKNIVISANGKDIGFGGKEFQQTISLRNAFKRAPTVKQMYAIGTEQLPEVIENEKQWGVGLTSIEGSRLVLDSVQAAIDNLIDIKHKIHISQQNIQNSISYMSVKDVNLQAARSNLKEINFAEETNSFNKKQLLREAGSYVLAQSQKLQQNRITDLLDNSK